MSNTFIKLKTLFNDVDAVYDYVLNTESWNTVGFGFDVVRIPLSIIKNDVLSALSQRYGLRPAVLRMPARYWYKWHEDADRTAAINIQIHSTYSHTLYGDDSLYGNKENLEELIYEPGAMYLLNTKVPHCVLNLGEVRYMLSYGFVNPITYTDIRDYCIDNNI